MKLKRIAAAVLAAAMLVLTAATVSADSIFDTAKNIDSGKKVSKTMDTRDTLEYKITPTEKGTATVKLTFQSDYLYFTVYDANGEKVAHDYDISMGSTTSTAYVWDRDARCFKGTLSFEVKANKTYYIQFKRNSAIGSGKIEASFKYPSEEKEPTALMTLNLKKGDTVQLGANGDNASWKSSQKSVATVSGSGLVTAVKKGKTVITLKCGSKKQEIEVVVE